jgi:hypothetical protein
MQREGMNRTFEFLGKEFVHISMTLNAGHAFKSRAYNGNIKMAIKGFAMAEMLGRFIHNIQVCGMKRSFYFFF